MVHRIYEHVDNHRPHRLSLRLGHRIREPFPKNNVNFKFNPNLNPILKSKEQNQGQDN